MNLHLVMSLIPFALLAFGIAKACAAFKDLQTGI